MKHLGYIQLIVLVLLVWLGWQMIGRIAFHSKHFVNTCYPTELMMNC